MGLGGLILLALIAGTIGYILVTEKTFQKEQGPEDPFAGLPKYEVNFSKVPLEMTERMTPKWQVEFDQKLLEEGYVLIGDYSYA
jgi:hypothetical protein